ncbi:DEAD/DEAH box helicase [Litorivita pollutaquae]|uniref:DEAD-box ATP-dependent RNA helicase RhpA n=1 Tax=Litorivita pollutaquae TaxID=2200892 RepID=A0A2V4NF45_9RHOB|nr:DEAD/DEAH box helicase [Litorivita pollutaquae]PYC48520.1 DEAD/DEAH box helicase [Litorivita pollutaquae]
MTKFTDLNLNPKVLKAIAEAGYESPTPIQAGAIPPALEGKDVLGIAQTGTGKTASFTLPMITMLARGRARARMPRSLVLCPTRELAAQVAENFDTYTKHLKLTKALLIGGVSFKEQDQLIDRGVDVLIATPGRLLDHFERGKLLLTGVQIMVVDEADRMLDMGFIPDIERIFSLTPFTRQTLFFSATMAPEIERITNTFLSAPARIEVARQATASENITQGVVMFKASRKDREASEKRKLLRDLIESEGDKCRNAIIFCNRKLDVDAVAKSMKKYGLDAAPIHGDLEQSARMRTLDAFRDGTLRFLVASDVAARGLDIPNVSHVFNFDVPSHAEDYVHRIGRTGRAGKDGTAIMICVPRDEKNFEDVERLVQSTIPRLAIPGALQPQKDAKPETPSEETPAATTPADTADEQPGGDEAGEAQPTNAQSAAAQAAEGEKDGETKPRRRTRGGRGRMRKEDDTTTAEAAAPAEAPEAAVTTTTSDASDAPQQDAAPAAPEENTSAAAEEKPRRSRGGRGRSRSNDNDGGGRDNNRVVGMGGHMPSFIEFSFDERRTS